MAAPTLPTTMRTLLQPDKYSKHLILTTSPLPTPEPNTDDHLIRVHAAALTNGELLWTKDYGLLEPHVPCYDIAGTVASAPSGSPFPTGSEIYARTHYTRHGSGKEYTIAPTSELAFKPKTLSFFQAATVPMSAQTAWQALFIHAGLQPVAKTGAQGKRVFITASSGTVGMWMVQLARWAGAEVIGTCNKENVESVKSLGASEALDYRSVNVKEWVEGAEGRQADVVIDCIGRQSLADAWWVVKDGGVLISIFQPPEKVKPANWTGKDVKNLFFVMDANGEQMLEVTKGLEEGRFVPGLDKVYPLGKFEEAVERLESGKTRGKVVLDLIST